MKNYILLFLIGYNYTFTFAQAHLDAKRNQTWLLGGVNNNFISGIPAYIDFTHYPASISYTDEPPTFYAPYAYGLISDINGHYLFYTNTSYQYDSTRQKLVNGDTLIPRHIGTGGWAAYQGTFILPYPKHQNQYYIPTIMFSLRLDLDGADRIVAAIADFDRRDGRGELINRSIIVHDTTHPNTGMGACRHANGRDWWLLGNRYDNSNTYNTYLLDPSGMRYVRTQKVGSQDTLAGTAGSSFSPDGTKYAIMDAHFTVDSQYVTLKHLKVFDFDRCNGRLSNPQEMELPLDRSWTVGLSFSPNGRFIYISNLTWVYQYDTQTQQLQTIATFDGYQDTDSQGYAAFGSSYLAADGKVYIATPQSTHYLHVIHQPDSLGAACGFEFRGITIPNTTNSNLPNMPYFALGAEDGTACDSLGYNQAHFAQLRIEPYQVTFQNVPTFSVQTQTVIARNIGDTTLIIQNPVIQQGIYTINLPTSIAAHSTATATISCLPTSASGSFQDTARVISNAIIARNLVFLDASVVVSTHNTSQIAAIKVFPNPTNGTTRLIWTEPLKENALIEISNSIGQLVQTVSIGIGTTQQDIDIKAQPNGIYFVSLRSKTAFSSVKLVKIE